MNSTAKIPTYSYKSFDYESATETLWAEASTLNLPVGVMPQEIKIVGKKETLTFRFDFAQLSPDNDVVWWEYNVVGHDNPEDACYSMVVRITND